MKNLNFNFSVQIYGELTPYNQVLSKARCRIFYKYENRNGTYITDEFAQKFVDTLAYVPVKGIYEDDDFTTHGKARDEGRIYGIVPKDHNFMWETHLDNDGVEREYACADVILFTSIYKEASEIVNKSLSMEIFPPSISGYWKMIEGTEYFVFTEGCFVGLQALGDDVEPCFEGAHFYTLQKELENLFDKIDKFTCNREETNSMKYIFELSNEDLRSKLFAALNPKVEDGYRVMTKWIVATFNDYVIVRDEEEEDYDKFLKIFYTVDEEDNVVLGDSEEVYNAYLSREELDSVESARALVNHSLVGLEEIVEKGQKYDTEMADYSAQISTLSAEKETLNTKIENYQADIEAKDSEIAVLSEFKKATEDSAKEAIFSKYSAKLSKETIDPIREQSAEMDCVQLEKELAFALIQNDNSIFSKEDVDDTKFPVVPRKTESGIEDILDRY